MSDWHFGMDYDMWLYPPVPFWDPDWDFDLPEPIEAANIEGTLLVNAEDAIEQVRRLQDENEGLRELLQDVAICACGRYCHGCPHQYDGCDRDERLREFGIKGD